MRKLYEEGLETCNLLRMIDTFRIDRYKNTTSPSVK